MSRKTFNYFNLDYNLAVFHITSKVRQREFSSGVFVQKIYCQKNRSFDPLSCNEYCFVRCLAILVFHISLSQGFFFKCIIEVELTTLFSSFITKHYSTEKPTLNVYLSLRNSIEFLMLYQGFLGLFVRQKSILYNINLGIK